MTHPAIGDTMIDQDRLSSRVQELGEQINQDYLGKRLLLIGILKSSFMFLADLARHIDLPVQFEFMTISALGDHKTGSGSLRIAQTLNRDIEDRHVIVIDTIIGSGLTLGYVERNFRVRHPASLEFCVLIAKEGLHNEKPHIKYNGFGLATPDHLIGYGLDINQRFRNLPYIARFNAPKV